MIRIEYPADGRRVFRANARIDGLVTYYPIDLLVNKDTYGATTSTGHSLELLVSGGEKQGREYEFIYRKERFLGVCFEPQNRRLMIEALGQNLPHGFYGPELRDPGFTPGMDVRDYQKLEGNVYMTKHMFFAYKGRLQRIKHLETFDSARKLNYICFVEVRTLKPIEQGEEILLTRNPLNWFVRPMLPWYETPALLLEGLDPRDSKVIPMFSPSTRYSKEDMDILDDLFTPGNPPPPPGELEFVLLP